MSDGSDLARVLLALHPEVTIVEREATGWFHPQPEHRGRPGWLHGGFAATVLDHVCARAAGSALGAPVVTGRLELRYPKPVHLDGGPYRVWAQAEMSRGRTVRVGAAMFDGDDRPMVEAESLFVIALRQDP